MPSVDRGMRNMDPATRDQHVLQALARLNRNRVKHSAVIQKSLDDDDSTGSTGSDSEWSQYSTDDDDYDSLDNESTLSWMSQNLPAVLVETDAHLIKTDATFHNSSPALAAMHTNLYKKNSRPKPTPGRVVRSESAPDLTFPRSLMERMAKADAVIGRAIQFEDQEVAKPVAPEVTPQEHFETLIQHEGVPVRIPALTLEGFFVPMTEKNVAAYDMPKVVAIRNNDVHALAEMHNQGQLLQVCNKFGESIVHSCCRRGTIEALRYLTTHAGVSVKVIDDYGRTPFHDACWTNKPDFDLVDILMNECPGLLLIADKRGCTPLDYVRKDYYKEWCEYLDKNRARFNRHALFSR